jgi:cytochrome o ubiquinol oxidase operon protein cyoD
MNGKNYFEEIGLWPRSHSVAQAYIVGFVLSLLLTIAAYVFVVQNILPYPILIATVIAAALLQFFVQVYCFLHIGGDASSRERLFALAFASLLICILVIGSLWIMFSLQSRMMPDTAQMEQYMNDQGGF